LKKSMYGREGGDCHDIACYGESIGQRKDGGRHKWGVGGRWEGDANPKFRKKFPT